MLQRADIAVAADAGGKAGRDDTRASAGLPRARWERWFALLALFMSTSAIMWMRDPPMGEVVTPPTEGGDPVTQAFWLLVYLVTALVFARLTGVLRTVRDGLPWLLWALIGWTALSLAWSADPATTARKIVALVGTVMFGIYLGVRFDDRALLRVNAALALGAGVLSLLVVAAMPEYGIMQHWRGAAWRGIYSHKNTLGLLSTWGTISCALAMVAARTSRERLLWLAGAGVSLALVVMSTSTTALVLLVAVPAIGGAAVLLARMEQPLGVGVTFLVAGTAAIALFLAAPRYAGIMEAIGRDATLTGRSDIWVDTWETIEHRSVTGYGYAAFWGGPASPARGVWARQGADIGITDFRAMSAHNGWLNLMAEIGLVGIVLFAGLFATVIVRCIAALRNTAGIITVMSVCFMVYFFLYNLVEGFIMRPNNFLWVMFIAVVVQVSSSAFRERRSRYSHPG